jgi:hypothetical protein
MQRSINWGRFWRRQMAGELENCEPLLTKIVLGMLRAADNDDPLLFVTQNAHEMYDM